MLRLAEIASWYTAYTESLLYATQLGCIVQLRIETLHVVLCNIHNFSANWYSFWSFCQLAHGPIALAPYNMWRANLQRFQGCCVTDWLLNVIYFDWQRQVSSLCYCSILSLVERVLLLFVPPKPHELDWMERDRHKVIRVHLHLFLFLLTRLVFFFQNLHSEASHCFLNSLSYLFPMGVTFPFWNIYLRLHEFDFYLLNIKYSSRSKFCTNLSLIHFNFLIFRKISFS